jgi:hypothetical protein
VIRGRFFEAAIFEAFSVESVRSVVVRCRTPTPCPSWASDSSSRLPTNPWPVARPRHRGWTSGSPTVHTEGASSKGWVLARCRVRGLQHGEPDCDLHEVWDVKERSEERSLRSGSAVPPLRSMVRDDEAGKQLPALPPLLQLACPPKSIMSRRSACIGSALPPCSSHWPVVSFEVFRQDTCIDI